MIIRNQLPDCTSGDLHTTQTQLFFIETLDPKIRTNDKDKKSIQSFKGNISSRDEEDNLPKGITCSKAALCPTKTGKIMSTSRSESEKFL